MRKNLYWYNFIPENTGITGTCKHKKYTAVFSRFLFMPNGHFQITAQSTAVIGMTKVQLAQYVVFNNVYS